MVPRYSLDIRKMCQRMFWKALNKHNPEKLVSHKNSYPTGNEKLTKTKYTISHTNYYCKSTDPKIPKPVIHASYHIRASLKIGITSIQYTKLKIWILD
jgi:hypothetical protein